MASAKFQLQDGYLVGEKKLLDVELREVTAGDIVEAQADSEKLVHTSEGWQFVLSPSAVGINVLRRQIVRIGDVDGPLSVKDICRLSARDLERLQSEADALEQAALAATASQGAAQRGRSEPGGG
jgi:phage FluMu protein gp41